MAKFPADIIAAAQATQHSRGIPASVTLAQWALESAYGTRCAARNNFFGIKAVGGQPAEVAWTHEVYNGVTKRVQARFAAYDTPEAGFEAHAAIFFNGHYKAALQHLGDPNAFAHALLHVYATDPDYDHKLIGIMTANNLYQYDKVA